MNITFKRVFFWVTFFLGCCFLWESVKSTSSSSSMVAFAVAVVFFLVACAIVLLGDVIFKPHNSNEEVSDSLILTQPPILLPYEKRFTEDGVPLSHVDMANGGNSLFDSRSPNSAILEEIFGDTEKDSQRFDGLISTWKDLHLSLEEKKK